MMRPLILAAAMAPALALPAAALEALCRFDTECYETQACEPADFEVEIAPTETPDRVRLGSVADNVIGAVSGIPEVGLTVVTARGPVGSLMLSFTERYARYTIHLRNGPLVVSYHGTCETR